MLPVRPGNAPHHRIASILRPGSPQFCLCFLTEASLIPQNRSFGTSKCLSLILSRRLQSHQFSCLGNSAATCEFCGLVVIR
jgi:hypothetical protein